jgi:hypothetical protein
VAGDTPVAAAICLPVQRCRRSRSTSSTTAKLVTVPLTVSVPLLVVSTVAPEPTSSE